MLHHHVPGHAPVTAADPASAQLEAARATAHHGPSARRARHGSALCLSGGGFRGALFHLGAVQRLDELGVLGGLRTISAVSGGSLVANLLAHPDLEWPEPGRPGRVGGLDELVVRPLRALTGRNVRTSALLSRFAPSGWGRGDASVRVLANELERAVPWWGTDLREHDRRTGPAILTGATEIGYGVSWVFADPRTIGPRGRVGDHRLGYAAPPRGLRIADAVAASCAYPPFFAPLELDGAELGLVGGVPDPDESTEVREGIRRRIQLVDGGVYDNMGLEPVWADHATVLVSDGGAVFRGRPAGSLVGRLWHMLSIASIGGTTTRLRWLRASFAAGVLQGATWSLESPNTVSMVPGHAPVKDYPGYPADLVATINRVRTDLDAFSEGEQMVLLRHGYLVADASLRRHSPGTVAIDAPVVPPHPQVAEADRAAAVLRGSERITALGRR